MNTNKRRQWSFIGLELRREGENEEKIMEAEIVGRRARGTQRPKIFDWMMKKLNVRDGKRLDETARHRRNWSESTQT